MHSKLKKSPVILCDVKPEKMLQNPGWIMGMETIIGLGAAGILRVFLVEWLNVTLG